MRAHWKSTQLIGEDMSKVKKSLKTIADAQETQAVKPPQQGIGVTISDSTLQQLAATATSIVTILAHSFECRDDRANKAAENVAASLAAMGVHFFDGAKEMEAARNQAKVEVAEKVAKAKVEVAETEAKAKAKIAKINGRAEVRVAAERTATTQANAAIAQARASMGQSSPEASDPTNGSSNSPSYL